MSNNYHPEVSVIIPVYNGELFIEDCMDSLLNQTVFDDIEIIVVDDASTDNTLQKLHKKLDGFNNVVILSNSQNLRQGSARNRGIKIARGDYIGFVDADDFVAPDLFEQLYSLAKENDSDAAYCKYISVNENTHYNGYKFEQIHNLSCVNNSLEPENRDNFLVNHIQPVWSGIYKKNIILENNIYFPEKMRFEDNYWVSLINCYLNKISSLTDYVGYYYRSNDLSTVHRRNDYGLYEERLKVENLLIDELKHRNLYNEYFDAWEYWYVYRYAVNTFYSYLTLFSSIPYSRINQLKRTLNEEFPYWRNNKYIKENTNSFFNKKLILFEKDVRKLSTKVLYFLISKKQNALYMLHCIKKYWRG